MPHTVTCREPYRFLYNIDNMACVVMKGLPMCKFTAANVDNLQDLPLRKIFNRFPLTFPDYSIGVQSPPPPQYRPPSSVERLAPPNTAADLLQLQVPNMFFLSYMNPFTAVFQYRSFFASPESGGIGGSTLFILRY